MSLARFHVLWYSTCFVKIVLMESDIEFDVLEDSEEDIISPNSISNASNGQRLIIFRV